MTRANIIKWIAALLSLWGEYAFAFEREVFNVKEVGLSNNTNTMFIVTSESASNSTCPAKNYFRMDLNSPYSALVYASAQTAMNNSHQIRIQYTNGECLIDSQRIEVFWVLQN